MHCSPQAKFGRPKCYWPSHMGWQSTNAEEQGSRGHGARAVALIGFRRDIGAWWRRIQSGMMHVSRGICFRGWCEEKLTGEGCSTTAQLSRWEIMVRHWGRGCWHGW
jgi:hypothetical protein